MKRLAIITTHPIQYNAPLFKMLDARGIIIIHVFYTWGQAVGMEKFDPGFNKKIQWDIDLLEGYSYSAETNTAKNPGSHHYNGIVNPDLLLNIQAFAPDALLVYGWRFQSHLKILKYFHKKVPIFFRGDSTLLYEDKGAKKLLRRIVLRYVYKHIDYALYAGTVNRDYFLASGLTASQLLYMPHTVDNSRFAYTTTLGKAALEWRTSHKIPADACVFLFAGKLDLNKRTELLATCFASLKLKKSFLLFAGSGPEEITMRKKFEKNKNIIFLGFVNQLQMPVIYNTCSVLVLPSAGETWGLCLNEAMAASRAVIASDACGAAYNLIQEGVNGFTFPKNGIEKLSKSLQFCSEYPNKVIEMGKLGFEIIKAYSLENNCLAIEAAVYDLGTL